MQTFDEIRGPGGNKRSSSFFECERGCTFKFLVQTFILLISLSALLTISLYNYLLIQTLRESDSYKDVRLFAGRLSGGAASTDQTSAPQAATTPDPASKPVAANSLELDVDAVTEKAELVAAEALMDVTRVPPVAAPAVVQKAPTEVVQQAALATTAPPPALTNPGESFGMAAFTSGKDVLSFTIPDADTITFSAWIYLPEIPGDAMPSESQSIKTIASTKTSGCESTPDSFGWAFFVHEWGSLNQQLRLQWTVAGTACLELRAKALVKYNKWQLVGFSFSGKRAMMYVGKQLVADSDAAEGDFFARGASYSGPLWPRDEANRATDKLFIGGFRPEAQGMHGFMGYMLDIRYYAHSWGTDAKQFFDFSTTRMDDAVAPDKKNLLDKTKVKAHIQFKQAPGPVENRITGEPGVAQSLMNPQQQGAPAPLFKSVPYVEKPDLSWIPKGPVSDINEITDVTPRPVLSDAEIKGAWPSRWTDKFSAEDLMKSQREADLMAEEVRKEMVHCWRGYKSTAWGRDEVRPVTGGGHNWVSIGITILDSLDTIYLMDLQQEFAEGEDFVRNLDFAAVRSGYHSLFEVTIRGLGGLLSAFSLSGHDIFLTKAADLGQRLMRAFVLESGLPKPQIDLASGGSRWVNWASGTNIAEVGTLQLEYRFLAAHTKRQEFWTTPDKAFMKIVENSENVGKGLVPIFLGSKQASAASGFFGSKISLGAMGDSYYEYLIKQYIQNGKRDTRYKNLFVKAMNEMMDRLIVKTNRGTIFVAEENGGRRLDRMDHLACFVSGMLLLGVMELPQSDVDPRWFPAAEGIAETCYKMYKLARTGLSPEYVKFDVNAKEGQPDIILPPDGAHNLLRPEAIEAIYYMWYYTGDPKYRVWAREMFLAFKKHSKAKYGYTALRDVRNPTIRSNQQESFWMAETMKYFYLIFSPRQRLDLHEWVLSTEAHPFKMPIEMPKEGR